MKTFCYKNKRPLTFSFTVISFNDREIKGIGFLPWPIAFKALAFTPVLRTEGT